MDAQIGNRLSGNFAHIVQFNLGPHEGESIKYAGAGGVNTNITDFEIAPQGPSYEPEGSRANITRYNHLLRTQALATAQADCSALNLNSRTKATQHPFGVIAGAAGFANTSKAIGVEASQQEARLNLG